MRRGKRLDNDRMTLAATTQMDRRTAAASEFYRKVIDPEERPFFVSDEATVFDVCTLSVRELVQRIGASYGIVIAEAELRVPIWKLLDRLTDVQRPRN